MTINYPVEDPSRIVTLAWWRVLHALMIHKDTLSGAWARASLVGGRVRRLQSNKKSQWKVAKRKSVPCQEERFYNPALEQSLGVFLSKKFCVAWPPTLKHFNAECETTGMKINTVVAVVPLYLRLMSSKTYCGWLKPWIIVNHLRTPYITFYLCTYLIDRFCTVRHYWY